MNQTNHNNDPGNVELLRILAFINEAPVSARGDHLSDEQMLAYARDRLSPSETGQKDQHLASCEECAQSLERLFSLRSALAKEAQRRRDSNRLNRYSDLNSRQKGSDLLVGDKDLYALRTESGVNAQRALELLNRRCLHRLCMSGILDHHTCLDIVAESIFEELESLFQPCFNAAEVSKRLERALDLNRRRTLRAWRTEAAIPSSQSSPVTSNELERLIEEEHQFKVTRLLKTYMSLALESLSNSDYDLLYQSYAFWEIGIEPPRWVETPRIPLRREAQRIAISRARLRFLKELDRISKASADLDEDKSVVQDALELLRSGRNMLRHGRR